MTSGFVYDAAGNLTQWPRGTVTVGADYDVEGRMREVRWNGALQERYWYDARGRRVRRGTGVYHDTWEVYGLNGELLGEYRNCWSLGGPWDAPCVSRERIHFGRHVAAQADHAVFPPLTAYPAMDRLGSVRAQSRYPYGE